MGSQTLRGKGRITNGEPVTVPADWVEELVKREAATRPPSHAITVLELARRMGISPHTARRFVRAEVKAGRLSTTQYLAASGKRENWVWPATGASTAKGAGK